MVAGRYRLERVLGEGACGRVYLARDTKERGCVWAVKEVDYSAFPIDEFQSARQQFQREAQLLCALRHPRLPRVIDHFQDEDRDYLVMERVEGPTLESLLTSRSDPLPESRVVELGLSLAEVLLYLHGRRPPVIYRDLKPANVMLTLDGGVKLIDFGIARSAHPGRPRDTTAFGTPGYAPPEQYQGKTQPASDLYALGMTLFRAATLYDPPEWTFDHPEPSSVNPELSPAFAGLLRSLLAKQADQRPTTEAVVGSLQDLQRRPGGLLWQRWWRRGVHWWRSRGRSGS